MITTLSEAAQSIEVKHQTAHSKLGASDHDKILTFLYTNQSMTNKAKRRRKRWGERGDGDREETLREIGSTTMYIVYYNLTTRAVQTKEISDPME